MLAQGDPRAESGCCYSIGNHQQTQPALLSPTTSRNSSLRGCSIDRTNSSVTSQDNASSVSTTSSSLDDEDDLTAAFEMDIDTPVSMCMRWQEAPILANLARTSSSSRAPLSSAASPDATDTAPSSPSEFIHTYASANAMSLRVNPSSGLLGFRRTTRRGSVTSSQEGSSLGQTLVDSSYTLPPKKSIPLASGNATPPSKGTTTAARSFQTVADVPRTRRPPASSASVPSSPPKLAVPSTTSTSSKLCKITPPPIRSSTAAVPPPPMASSYLPGNNNRVNMTTHPDRPRKPVTSILKVAPVEVATPPMPPPPTPADLADDVDESIFSSLRNVDLVSSRAPESARTREFKQKAAVNKNVVAFLGGYKGQSSTSHRLKVTSDIISRAKNIRKRAAEGQLSRKLQEARMRIPDEFQRSMDTDLPRKAHTKRIQFPDDMSKLEDIYVFDAEDDSSDDDEQDIIGRAEDQVAALVV
ncbi:hypothetical protein DYB35_012415 [Aphanomyces astaci]|uniref:Uncharacterized protein n=1 Tax=Aphanomyces astaci TaxID=112090 RepID=A0A3R6ZVN9_APHAT|nr:hypothetical protein DYB35_012415 [Aphanomyces astaci]